VPLSRGQRRDELLMTLTNTVRRSEDFARKRVLARPEFPLHEHPVYSSHGCQLALKSLTPVRRMAFHATAPYALLGGLRIFAIESAS
jgi:hypothetical protein